MRDFKEHAAVRTLLRVCGYCVESNGQRCPKTFPEVAHLLCVFSVESPVFAPAFKHAAALLGECANDGFIAVLCDVLDQAKEVGLSRDEEDEDCVLDYY